MLSREYDALWAPLIDTYDRNESWFKFHITFLTLVTGIVGVTFKIGETNEYVWEILSVFLLMLIIVGIGTLHVLIHNREIIVEYLNAINRIRKFFVDKTTENAEPDFRKYVLLPTTHHKYLKLGSVNFVLIYIVSFFNFLALIGFLLIYITKVYLILKFGYGSPLSDGIVGLIIVFFISIHVIELLIVRKDSKRNRNLMTNMWPV